MRLPKVNECKQKSRHMQTKLRIAILECVSNLEKSEEYDFLPYEMDNVLLSIIKDNHEAYLTQHFGNDTID